MCCKDLAYILEIFLDICRCDMPAASMQNGLSLLGLLCQG